MYSEELFKKYYARLAREGLIKAILYGLIVGFAVNFVVAFIMWFVSFYGVWISLGAGIAATAGATAFFYYKLFRPTTKQIAKRLDELGLEERMLTMTELEKSESYMAMLQREDAKEKLRAVDAKGIAYRISKAAIAVASVFVFFGLSMTTVTGLADGGILLSGKEVWEKLFPSEPKVYIEVYYVAGEGGSIQGVTEQQVLFGGEAQTVVAVAEDGWRFDGWSDGEKIPSRTDKNVKETFTVIARFVTVEDDLLPEQLEDVPQVPSEPQKQDPSAPPDKQTGNSEDNNKVLDGKTDYRDVYQEYYDRAMEMLANGEEIPAELREIIEVYYGILL